MMAWETVIGLEVHIQLNTQSKLFSGSSTSFGAEPNKQVSVIDAGMPGTLPVVNAAAVKKAIQFGLMIDSEINKTSRFDRKNYFYPDLPKGYQTTQLSQPIVLSGKLYIETDNGEEKVIRIHHAHLEEDAGKSIHDVTPGMTGIDLNRAGMPLIEVVTEPDIRSAEEAVLCAKKLLSVVTTLDICDGEMSQGSMRFDVNISMRRPGDPLGVRTETKNLNSFKFMEMAIENEVNRQISILEVGGEIIQETRLFNGITGKSQSMRSKEEEDDYRYFSCPDLLPIVIEDKFIQQLKETLPENLSNRKKRLMRQYDFSEYDAGILTTSRFMADYFEEVVKHCSNAKLAANWIMGELAKELNKYGVAIQNSPVTSQVLGGLIIQIEKGVISGNIAKQVFQHLYSEKGKTAEQVIQEQGLKQVQDEGEIETVICQVLSDNQEQVRNYQASASDKKGKMLGFFVGKCMKAFGGKANPGLVNKLLKEKLDDNI